MKEYRTRKNPRLADFNYRGHDNYFVTLCSFKRHAVFLDKHLSRWLLELLQTESARLYFQTHAYCLMADHLHFLSEGLHATSDPLHFVKCLKLKSRRFYAGKFGGILWQKGLYEHVLRADDPLEGVAWYIWLNPVRKGIVQRPEDYLYSGSFSGWTMPAEWEKQGWRPPWRRELTGVAFGA
jgi:putative transposase